MGAWGPAIFSNDTASDVKDDYRELLGMRLPDEKVNEIIIKEYEELKGTDDECVFWIAFALCQWNAGRLTEEVKQKALDYIASGEDLERWKESGKSAYTKRKKALEDVKQKLESPMPKPKRYPPVKGCRCPWKQGDLLAYRITNYRGVPEDFYDKYVLLRVVNVDRCPVSQLIPEYDYSEYMDIALYEWLGDRIPDASIVQNLKFVYLHRVTNPDGKEIKFMLTGLNWETTKRITCDIQAIGHDPLFHEHMPAELRESLASIGSMNCYAFDIRLPIYLKNYLESKE